jgi:hypothetical protein
MIVFFISAALKYFCSSYSGEHIGSDYGVSCSEVKKRKDVSTKLVPGDIGFDIFPLMDGPLCLGM